MEYPYRRSTIRSSLRLPGSDLFQMIGRPVRSALAEKAGHSFGVSTEHQSSKSFSSNLIR